MAGFVFGPAVEVGAVKEAEDGRDVVVAIVEVFGLASESECDAEIDADAAPVNTAEIGAAVETGDKSGDTAGAEFEVLPEPKFVAELDLVVSGYETYQKISSEFAVVWNSGVLLGVVFEPRVGFVFVDASEAECMMAPSGNIQDTLFVVLTGAHFGATVVEPELLDKAETGEPDLFAEGTVGELDVSAGQLLVFVTLVWVSTAGMESDPGGSLAGNMEAVL